MHLHISMEKVRKKATMVCFWLRLFYYGTQTFVYIIFNEEIGHGEMWAKLVDKPLSIRPQGKDKKHNKQKRKSNQLRVADKRSESRNSL